MTDKAGHAVREPRIRHDVTPGAPAEPPRRAVQVVLSPDWAMVLHRQQQLLNQNAEGVNLHIFRDAQGLVRIDLNE